jgi:hypothetical protein
LTLEVAAGGLYFVRGFLIVIEILIAPKRFGAQHLLIIHRGGNFAYVVHIYCRYKYEFFLSCIKRFTEFRKSKCTLRRMAQTNHKTQGMRVFYLFYTIHGLCKAKFNNYTNTCSSQIHGLNR